MPFNPPQSPPDYTRNKPREEAVAPYAGPKGPNRRLPPPRREPLAHLRAFCLCLCSPPKRSGSCPKDGDKPAHDEAHDELSWAEAPLPFTTPDGCQPPPPHAAPPRTPCARWATRRRPRPSPLAPPSFAPSQTHERGSPRKAVGRPPCLHDNGFGLLFPPRGPHRSHLRPLRPQGPSTVSPVCQGTSVVTAGGQEVSGPLILPQPERVPSRLRHHSNSESFLASLSHL